MRDHGHPNADLYPVGMVRDEAAIVRARVNADIVAIGLLVQAAGMSVMAPEAGGEYFQSLIGSMIED